MIKLPELDSRFTNVNDGGNTVRDLRLSRLEEALKNAVSEKQLEERDSIIQVLKFDVIELGKRLANIKASVTRLELAEDALNKRVKELEKPKPASQLEPIREQFQVNEPKEVQSTSWKEKLIKLLQK